MADDQIAISIRGASKTYGGGVNDAIRDIWLDIKCGEFLVIVGESGSGKTTLLKTINRLIDPTTGTVRVFDVSDPHKPRVAHEQKIGAQLNMVSESWDGERVYFTSSLLSKWDKKGADNEQYLKAYDWDGKTLTHRFTVDFTKETLGRPHLMSFGQEQFYKNQIYTAADGRVARATL